MTEPSHHAQRGRYRNPWPLADEASRGPGDMLRWSWQRFRHGRPPDPPPERIPRAAPDPARPRLEPGAAETRLTWIGQSSFLVQMPGVNLLTDPMFSERASPVQWAGPARLTPPGMALAELPPIDLVLLSHDHYDHLDAPTVDGLRDRYGARLPWLTPLGYRRWFERRGCLGTMELDWWDATSLETAAGATVRITALPARHWTNRGVWTARRRLWCSWSVEVAGRSFYFGGDTGYGPAFSEIGERAGPFEVAVLPIGAYEPRWFMAPAHMNPEEAARAAVDLGAAATVGSHWGTFRLTDEDPLEPPERARAAWNALGTTGHTLYIAAVGETLRFCF